MSFFKGMRVVFKWWQITESKEEEEEDKEEDLLENYKIPGDGV